MKKMIKPIISTMIGIVTVLLILINIPAQNTSVLPEISSINSSEEIEPQYRDEDPEYF